MINADIYALTNITFFQTTTANNPHPYFSWLLVSHAKDIGRQVAFTASEQGRRYDRTGVEDAEDPSRFSIVEAIVYRS